MTDYAIREFLPTITVDFRHPELLRHILQEAHDALQNQCPVEIGRDRHNHKIYEGRYANRIRSLVSECRHYMNVRDLNEGDLRSFIHIVGKYVNIQPEVAYWAFKTLGPDFDIEQYGPREWKKRVGRDPEQIADRKAYLRSFHRTWIDMAERQMAERRSGLPQARRRRQHHRPRTTV